MRKRDNEKRFNGKTKAEYDRLACWLLNRFIKNNDPAKNPVEVIYYDHLKIEDKTYFFQIPEDISMN